VTRPLTNFCLCIALWPCFAIAECSDNGSDGTAPIQQRGVLRIATTSDYRPFSFIAEDGTRRGIDIDVAHALADALGVRIEWVATSWPTLLDDLSSGRFDIAMSGISVTRARSATGCFSASYFSTAKTPLWRCTDPRDFTSLQQIDRPDVTVIVNPGGTNEQFARTHLYQARLLPHPDNLTIFDALARGDADVFITDAVEARLATLNQPDLCMASDVEFEPVDKAYLMPDEGSIDRWLNAWLPSYLRSADYAAVIDRYLPGVLPANP
jgi:cyclohexadienyl dehydratase